MSTRELVNNINPEWLEFIRNTLILKITRGYSNSQVSKELGVSASTVSSRLRRYGIGDTRVSVANSVWRDYVTNDRKKKLSDKQRTEFIAWFKDNVVEMCINGERVMSVGQMHYQLCKSRGFDDFTGFYDWYCIEKGLVEEWTDEDCYQSWDTHPRLSLIMIRLLSHWIGLTICNLMTSHSEK